MQSKKWEYEYMNEKNIEKKWQLKYKFYKNTPLPDIFAQIQNQLLV